MESHESYYTSTHTPLASSQSPSSAGMDVINHQLPPPPPPPKSHDTSRTNTPTAPPIPSHPNAAASMAAAFPPQYSPNSSTLNSRAPPPPPHTPSQLSSRSPQSSIVHEQAQNLATHHSQYYQQQQQQHPPPPPPLPHNDTGPIAQPIPTPPVPTTGGGPGAPATSTSILPPPLDSGWLPENLKAHSTTDLQSLLLRDDDNDKQDKKDLLDALAKQHPAYAATMEQIQAAIAANLTLAQRLVAQEAQVKQLREQTGQLLLNHTSLQTQWRRKQSEVEDALSSWGPRAMYSRLVSSINEQEAILHAVHESFVEGGVEDRELQVNGNGKASEKELTEWVKRIREGTTLLEKRREMRQRWDEGRVGGWR